MVVLLSLCLIDDFVNSLSHQAIAGSVGMDRVTLHAVVTQQVDKDLSLKGDTLFFSYSRVEFWYVESKTQLWDADEYHVCTVSLDQLNYRFEITYGSLPIESVLKVIAAVTKDDQCRVMFVKHSW